MKKEENDDETNIEEIDKDYGTIWELQVQEEKMETKKA